MISTSWKKFPNCARIEIDTYLHQNIPVFYVRCLELMFKFFSVFLKKDNCSKWFFGKISKLCRKTKLICIYFRDPWYSVLRFDTYLFYCVWHSDFIFFIRYVGDGEILKTLFKRHGQPLETPPYLRGKSNWSVEILNSIVRCNVSNI